MQNQGTGERGRPHPPLRGSPSSEEKVKKDEASVSAWGDVTYAFIIAQIGRFVKGGVGRGRKKPPRGGGGKNHRQIGEGKVTGFLHRRPHHHTSHQAKNHCFRSDEVGGFVTTSSRRYGSARRQEPPTDWRREGYRVLASVASPSYLSPSKKPLLSQWFLLGGGWWIRTTEVSDNRFTVCPLWPLGKSPKYGAGERSRTINRLITNQVLCH